MKPKIRLCSIEVRGELMGELMICVGMGFDFTCDVVLIAFLSSQTYKQSLGTNLGVRESKLGILGEKWCEPVRVHSKQRTVRLSELQRAPSVCSLKELFLSECSLEYGRLKRMASLEANGPLTAFLV